MADTVLDSRAASTKAPQQPQKDIRDPDAAEALRDVPNGALVLASTTVALLLIAWLIVYFFAFLPRGTVG